jgi:hypothetical protein
MVKVLDLKYYIKRGSTLGAMPASYWNDKSKSGPSKNDYGFFYVGTWQGHQNPPWIDSKDRICRTLYGKKVVLERQTKAYQEWLKRKPSK